MAQEYISRKPLLQYLEETVPESDWLVNQFNADWIHSFIESPLAADVVPREEFEALQRRYDLAVAEREANAKALIDANIGLDAIRCATNSLKMHYENAKHEIAREIFAEIEQYLVKCSTMDGNSVYSISKHTFNRIKKKYTEGGVEENDRN